MKPIYLLCGVSGSGKSWVCQQLKSKFTYVAHDQFFVGERIHHAQGQRKYIASLIAAAAGDKPVITECPFAERQLKEQLERAGLKVIPYFVIEPTDVVRTRFRAREGQEPSQNVLTRSVTIRKRAEEWKAPSGTSTAIRDMLQKVG